MYGTTDEISNIYLLFKETFAICFFRNPFGLKLLNKFFSRLSRNQLNFCEGIHMNEMHQVLDEKSSHLCRLISSLIQASL